MGRIYGYCRISRRSQNIERQVRNIEKAYPGADLIVKEIFTGTKFQGRKELNKLINIVQSGDTIVFDSVSRMSRNAEEGIELYQELYEKGISLIFLKEPHINTSVYRSALERQISLQIDTGRESVDRYMTATLEALNTLMMDLAREQIQLAFGQAQKEVDDLHIRTKEGIETARLNGKQIGGVTGKKLTTKKSVKAKGQIRKYSKDFDGSLGDKEVMKLVGIANNTFYKYKKEMRIDLIAE